jgi:RNA recognition motif-containing protein
LAALVPHPSVVSVPRRCLTKTISLSKEKLLMTNIFVGNLSFQTTQEELHAAFSNYGNVERVNIVTDRDSGQPRGFAFVEMTDRSAAEAAITKLNGTDLNGRTLNVNEARPKPQGGSGHGNRGGGSNRSRGARW